MKKLFYRLLLFCLAPLPFLYYLDHIVDSGLKRSRGYYYTEWNDLFDSKINADLLIIGSSRAWVHISPRILDSALNTNSYNLGLDASHFLMQYDRFFLYLKHNKKPKYLIISVDLTTFAESREIPFREQFLPYLKDPDVRRMLKGYSNSFNWFQLHFPLYKYNNEPDLFAGGIGSYFGKAAADTPFKYKGYLGVQKKWDNSFDRYRNSHPRGEKLEISPVSEKAFGSLLAYCKSNNIKPIIVFTPVFHESLAYVSNSGSILNFYPAIARKYDVKYINYAFDHLSYRRQFFYNSQHLNKAGAELLSKQLANDLKPVMNIK